MIRTVERYQTLDGQLFNSVQQAQRHADDLVCERVEALLVKACPGFNRPSTQKAVLALAASPEETRDLLRAILAALEFGESDDD